MSLNITRGMSEQEIIEAVQQYIVVPSVISIYVVFAIVYLAIGFMLIDEKKGDKPYQKFFFIWLLSVAVSGILLVLILNMPNAMQWIAETWQSVS